MRVRFAGPPLPLVAAQPKSHPLLWRDRCMSHDSRNGWPQGCRGLCFYDPLQRVACHGHQHGRPLEFKGLAVRRAVVRLARCVGRSVGSAGLRPLVVLSDASCVGRESLHACCEFAGIDALLVTKKVYTREYQATQTILAKAGTDRSIKEARRRMAHWQTRAYLWGGFPSPPRCEELRPGAHRVLWNREGQS